MKIVRNKTSRRKINLVTTLMFTTFINKFIVTKDGAKSKCMIQRSVHDIIIRPIITEKP